MFQQGPALLDTIMHSVSNGPALRPSSHRITKQLRRLYEESFSMVCAGSSLVGNGHVVAGPEECRDRKSCRRSRATMAQVAADKQCGTGQAASGGRLH